MQSSPFLSKGSLGRCVFCLIPKKWYIHPNFSFKLPFKFQLLKTFIQNPQLKKPPHRAVLGLWVAIPEKLWGVVLFVSCGRRRSHLRSLPGALNLRVTWTWPMPCEDSRVWDLENRRQLGSMQHIKPQTKAAIYIYIQYVFKLSGMKCRVMI